MKNDTSKPNALLEPEGLEVPSSELDALFKRLLERKAKLKIHSGNESIATTLLNANWSEDDSSAVIEELPSTFLGHAENRENNVHVRTFEYRAGYLWRITFHATLDKLIELDGHPARLLLLTSKLYRVKSLILGFSQNNFPLTFELVVSGAPVRLFLHEFKPEDIGLSVHHSESLAPLTSEVGNRHLQYIDLDQSNTLYNWLRLVARTLQKSGKLIDPLRDSDSHPEASESPEEAIGDGKKALLVIRNEKLRSSISELLEECGYAVTQLDDYYLVNKLEEPLTNISLLVLDAIQGSMHAIDWLQMMRDENRIDETPFVIVGDSLAKAREPEWQDLGRGLFLRQNLPKAWMRKKLTAWFAGEQSIEAGTDDSLQKILVVDDDLDLLDSLGGALTSRNFQVMSASDGERAISGITRFHPDLVLLDIDMPKKTGIEVLREIRGSSHTHSLPVVMMTANSDHTFVDLALELGISDYIVKPFNEFNLIQRIRAILANSSRLIV